MGIPGCRGEYHETLWNRKFWGVGVKLETPSLGGMDIFWNYTMAAALQAAAIRKVQKKKSMVAWMKGFKSVGMFLENQSDIYVTNKVNKNFVRAIVSSSLFW